MEEDGDVAKEGFICPECAYSAESMEDLLVHFEGHINNRITESPAQSPKNKAERGTSTNDTEGEGNEPGEESDEDCDWDQRAAAVHDEFRELQLTNEQLGMCLAHIWQVLQAVLSKREEGQVYDSSQVVTLSQAVAGVKQCRDVLLERIDFWNCALPSQCEALLATIDETLDEESRNTAGIEAGGTDEDLDQSQEEAEVQNHSLDSVEEADQLANNEVTTDAPPENEDSAQTEETQADPNGTSTGSANGGNKKVFDPAVSAALLLSLTGDSSSDNQDEVS